MGETKFSLRKTLSLQPSCLCWYPCVDTETMFFLPPKYIKMYTGGVSSLAEQIANQLQRKEQPKALLDKKELLCDAGSLVSGRLARALAVVLSVVCPRTEALSVVVPSLCGRDESTVDRSHLVCLKADPT
ncbi:hypothetical protein P7K49_003118 [Saguinus oedipus]|uniref:Uncharacterized protein n=1 Tax=Saguinus oedipus TaxID=9490 RepID=A0ABQ9WNB4_SAGOE|nr:hypothetical protein P7K49_003118 [Saguinus oedipus]